MDVDEIGEIYKKVKKEFATICAINTCPHIIRVLGIVTKTHGQVSILMEFAAEGSLRDYIDKYKNEHLPKSFVHNVIYDIAYALKALHAHSVYHRDLKAANVFLLLIAKILYVVFGSSFGFSTGSICFDFILTKYFSISFTLFFDFVDVYNYYIF